MGPGERWVSPGPPGELDESDEGRRKERNDDTVNRGRRQYYEPVHAQCMYMYMYMYMYVV